MNLPNQLTFGTEFEPMLDKGEEMKIKDIIITKPVRQDLGDLQSLADSIRLAPSSRRRHHQRTCLRAAAAGSP